VTLYIVGFLNNCATITPRSTMKQIHRFVEVKHHLFQQQQQSNSSSSTVAPTFLDALIHQMVLYDRSFSMRYMVHEFLFMNCIKNQGTEEQQMLFLEAHQTSIVSSTKQPPLLPMIGCFAMTELGHSSDLRGIETTATYVHETREFIIHTPTLLSTKWWIGMSGETATHTVALCKLVMVNQEQQEKSPQQPPLHWFLVPLRDTATGELLPGVTAGSLGEKQGRPGLDK